MTTPRTVILGILGLLVVPAAVVLWVRAREGGQSASIAPVASQGTARAHALPLPDDGPLDRSRRLARVDPAESRMVLRRALAAHPDDAALMAVLSKKLLLDESVEARPLAVECLQRDPAQAVCAEVLRRSLDPERRDDRTSAFLDNCLAADPERPACLAALAVERLRARDQEGAKVILERLVRAAPEAPLSALIEGRVASARGDYASARAHFDEACLGREEYACYRASALREDGW